MYPYQYENPGDHFMHQDAKNQEFYIVGNCHYLSIFIVV